MKKSMDSHNGFVMIVDDNVENIDLIGEILNKNDYSVKAFSDVKSGLSSAVKQPPYLILINVRLHGLKIEKFLQDLKGNVETANIPVVLVMEKQTRDAVANSINAGCVDYITKPFQEKNIVSCVQTHYDLYITQLHLEELIAKRTREIQNTRQRLTDAYTVSRMGFLNWNLKTNEIELSDEIIELYGLDPTAKWTTPDFVATVVYQEDMDFVQKNLELALKMKKRYNIDHRIIRPDGKIIWVHAQADMLLDEKKQPQSLLGTVVDITERKQAEEALRKSESKYLDLYENAPDMYGVINAKSGIIEHCNQTMANRLGYRKEEIIGKPVLGFYHKDSVKAAGRAFDQLVKKGTHGAKDFQLKLKDGTKLEVNLNVSLIKDENDNVLYVRSTWRDITNHRESIAALEKRIEELVQHELEDDVLAENKRLKEELSQLRKRLGESPDSLFP